MNSETVFQEFTAKGFTLIENFITSSEVENLLQESSTIVQNMEFPKHCSVFHTGKDQARDEYFITSGDKISFFFEKDAVNEKGDLVVCKENALNKIGHALHWLNPSFKRVTFNVKVKEVMKILKYNDPVVVQSMIIFKHPEIGGLVTPHQDSTFLYTEPPSAVGLWIPLVDITLENGCLWFIPGSHKDKVHQRYVRNPSGNPSLTLKNEIPQFDDNLYVPVLPKKVIVLLFMDLSFIKVEKILPTSQGPFIHFILLKKMIQNTVKKTGYNHQKHYHSHLYI